MHLRLLWMVSLFFSVSASAKDGDSTFYCKQSSVIGLFEQCQDVLVQNVFENGIQAYSRPLQEVRTLPKSDFFKAAYLAATDSVKNGEVVIVLSSFLWNSSSIGFGTRCRVHEDLKNEFMRISCGQFQEQTIKKVNALRIKPYK